MLRWSRQHLLIQSTFFMKVSTFVEHLRNKTEIGRDGQNIINFCQDCRIVPEFARENIQNFSRDGQNLPNLVGMVRTYQYFGRNSRNIPELGQDGRYKPIFIWDGRKIADLGRDSQIYERLFDVKTIELYLNLLEMAETYQILKYIETVETYLNSVAMVATE